MTSTRSLSANERTRVQEILKSKNSYDVFLDSLSHADKLRLIHNNKPFKSTQVLRQAKSTTKTQRENSFTDEMHKIVGELCSDNRFGVLPGIRGFIKLFGEFPLTIHMYSANQIKLAARHYNLRWDYLDATGTMI